MRRLAIVLALVIGFVWTVPAFGACAWVLWEQAPQQTAGDIADPSRRWSTVGSATTLKDCQVEERKLYALMADARARGQNVARSLLVCLPDTIDPRGPKGK